MIDIKSLNLTEKDFKLLLDGLDALPNADQAGELMHSLLIGIVTKDNDEERQKMVRERDIQKAKAAAAKQQKLEDVKILQGKLLMLKRWLLQEGAIKQANDILNLRP